MQKSLTALLLVLAGVAAGDAQQSTPASPQTVTFRTEINFVEVHAIVTDSSGAFVRGLTGDDFEIYEDGRLQKPAAFSLIDLPVDQVRLKPDTTYGGPELVEPDVRSTTRTFDGRIYIFLLDDLHTDVRRSLAVQQAARTFVAQYLGPTDLAAVVSTVVYQTRIGVPAEEFPNDRVRSAYAGVQRLYRRIAAVESDHQLELVREPDPGFAWQIHRWADGAALEEVLADGDLSPGDFVRSSKQVWDLLRQLAELEAGETFTASCRDAARAIYRGVVATSVGLFGGIDSTSQAALLLGLGAVLLFMGTALLSPRFVAPLASAVGVPLERVRKLTGRLARENAVRNPGRTATTAAALMIGLALVTFVAVFAAGINASIDDALDKNVTGALALQHEDGF